MSPLAKQSARAGREGAREAAPRSSGSWARCSSRSSTLHGHEAAALMASSTASQTCTCPRDVAQGLMTKRVVVVGMVLLGTAPAFGVTQQCAFANRLFTFGA